MTLQAIDCQTGDTLAQELVEVRGKEDVLSGVGRATTAMRERLGESLTSIARTDTPISQATTPSLDALKALSQADELRAQGKRMEALAMFKRALELDPEFALAHARIGALYQNLLDMPLGRSHRQRAFELRHRASERERFYIDAHYYQNIAFDRVKARSTFEQWSQTYPRDASPSNNLGVLEGSEGRPDLAVGHYQRALQIDPSLELVHTNVVNSLTVLGRLDDADAVLKNAIARFGTTAAMAAASYSLAFVRKNHEEMARLASTAADSSIVATLVAQAEAYRGRIGEARARTLRSYRRSSSEASTNRPPYASPSSRSARP